MVTKIFNIIGWLGTALVLGAVLIRFGMPAREQYAYYMAWGGLVCMLLYMLSQWREIAGMFSRRQTRYGSLLAVSVLVALGILVAINYIGKRQNKRWDLTNAKQYSLSDQTRNVLTKLDSPLEILVFAQEPEFPMFRDRLKEYEYASKQVATQYIDPDKQRTLAQQNAVQQYGTVIFKYKDRTERVTQSSEQDLTNGIIKAVSGQQKKVYFTQGHGEKDPTSADRDGFGTVGDGLKRENYTVEKLVLAQAGSVPDDASVVVVAGPQTDFFPPEIEALKTYLTKNGKLLLMLDPPAKADAAQATSLIALAHDWGMDVGNNIVVDASGMGRLIGTDASVPVVAAYPPHPDHRALQHHHRLSAGALDHAGGRRRQRPHRSDLHRVGCAQLGGSGRQVAARLRRSVARRSERRQAGPGVARRGGFGERRPGHSADARRQGCTEAGNPGRRHRRLRLRQQWRARHSGQSRPVHEHRRMAVAAGEPDLDQAEGSRATGASR